MAHVAKWKFSEVEQLTQMLTENTIIGIAEIGGIPAPQLQQMRKNLRQVAQIRSAKNSLILRALDEAEKKTQGIGQLKELLHGQAALIATDMNPFKLYKQLADTRTMAPAKGGETATHDIMVKAGDTPFKPGPIVGELQKAGIPAAIQEGKVIIKTDKVIVPAGEKIPGDVAQMLTRLEIFPIEIGMNLHAVFEDGTIYKPDVLDIDSDQFRLQMQQARTHAFSLALEAGWVTTQTIQPLLQKAYQNALALALDQTIVSKETIHQLLSKAHGAMSSLASRCSPEALHEDLKKKET